MFQTHSLLSACDFLEHNNANTTCSIMQRMSEISAVTDYILGFLCTFSMVIEMLRASLLNEYG